MNSPLTAPAALRRLVAMIFSALAFASPAIGQLVINTTASSEGLALRDFSFSPGSTSIMASSASYSVTYDVSTFGKYTTMPVFNFPLVSLAGQTISAVSLNIYTSGIGTNAVFSINDYSAAVNTSGTSTATYAQSTNGNLLLDITGHAAGWISVDVTSSIANALSQGWSWITYNIRVAYPTSGQVANGTIAGFPSANAPYLAATTVPEPSTWGALAGILALGAAIVHRRANRRA